MPIGNQEVKVQITYMQQSSATFEKQAVSDESGAWSSVWRPKKSDVGRFGIGAVHPVSQELSIVDIVTVVSLISGYDSSNTPSIVGTLLSIETMF